VASCRTPQLRQQLWCWLEEVVEWLVAEYVWEVADTIPALAPAPHLVHEIAVLADQRRRAGHALTSDALEEWHRCNLPGFTETDEIPASEPLRRRPPNLAGERPLHPAPAEIADAPGRTISRRTSVP
jgi:hypothetical protein